MPTSRGSVGRFLPLFAGIAALVLLLAACGGSSTASDGVARLDETTSSAADSESDGDEVDEEEALLAFAQCMREEGVDWPDPTVGDNGNLGFGGALRDGDIDFRSPEVTEAREQCSEGLEDVTFGRGRLDEEGQTQMQDALVEFTECLRDEGLDVGDIDFGGGAPGGGAPGGGAPGGGAPDGGAPDGGAPGERPAGGSGDGAGPRGDPSARIAEILDLDPDDPDVQAALETCQPVLEQSVPSGPQAPE